MNLLFRRTALGAALAALVLAPLAASPAAAEEAAMPAGFRADLLANFDFTVDRINQLADAIPLEKYSWRPAEGVRSVGEVIGHVAVGNYYLASFLGAAMPEGISMESEKEPDPAKLHAMLAASIEHVHAVVDGFDDAKLENEVDFFGNKVSSRGLMLIALGHVHEHLGQLIAYARSNGVVPPWSMPAPEEGAAEMTEGEEMHEHGDEGAH